MSSSPSSFEGKAVIVTGASSGIGESVALKLAKQGARITLCGRDHNRLKCVLEKCRLLSKSSSNPASDKIATIAFDEVDRCEFTPPTSPARVKGSRDSGHHHKGHEDQSANVRGAFEKCQNVNSNNDCDKTKRASLDEVDRLVVPLPSTLEPERKVSGCKNTANGIGGQLETERFIAVEGDVNLPAVREEILQKTLDAFGRLDVLVANAGLALNTSVETETEEEYDLIMNTMLKSVYFLVQKCLPHLERTKGNIVCVSSIASSNVFPFLSPCVMMSKAALDHLVRTLAVSQGPKGIRVNAVNPTLTQTRLWQSFPAEGPMSEQSLLENYGGAHPLHGRVSSPGEQADAVLFLASDSANFVSGQCLRVDGAISWGQRS